MSFKVGDRVLVIRTNISSTFPEYNFKTGVVSKIDVVGNIKVCFDFDGLCLWAEEIRHLTLLEKELANV